MAGGQPQDLGRGDLPGLLAGQELQAALELLGVDRHPLAAQPDERGLGRGERGDLLLGQGVIADGELPAEVHQLFPAELVGLLHHAVNRGVRGRGEPEPRRRSHQEGSKTPNPASSSAGAATDRN